ncbi:MAG: hypothetical protein ACYS9X_06595 [Planctomycetota bacterium]|jgi:hypothetical protein
MGKLFWIGCGVGLLAAVGLWVGMTMSIRGEVVGLHKDVDMRRNELRNWATKKFGEIKNQSFIDVEKAYQQDLEATKTELLEQMRAGNMSIDPTVWDPPAPMHEVSRFRTWLTTKYNERNSKLREADVIVPDDPVGLGEVPNWDDVRKEDLPRILREYRISCEVFTALAEATAKVRYRAKVAEAKGDKLQMELHENEEDQEKKVVEIETLRFEEEGKPGPRPVRPRPGAAAAKPRLFIEHEFAAKFNAHHGVAIDFIRRLESSEAGVFIVRTVEVGRIDRPDLKRRGSDEEDEENPYKNRLRNEAPAVVEVTASLLEFTEQDKKEAE